jgi:twinkle protein
MYYDKLSSLGIKLNRRMGSEKTKCPQCSDGRKNKADKPLSVNVTTGEYCCHNCGWKGNVRTFERNRDKKKYEKPPADVLLSRIIREKTERYFASRGISLETLNRFLVYSKEEYMPQTQGNENCICFPYLRDGEVVNVKYRDAKKNFKLFKDAELIFYNLPSVSDKKFCIITEGEIDCMSLYESGFGKEADENGEPAIEDFSKWGIVSVPNGASKGNQKLEYLDNCSDWFIGLHEIIVATDGDEAGHMLKDELIRRLGVERCKTINYPIEEVVPLENGLKRRCKDMNEVLKYLGKEVVVNVIRNAENIPIDGVYYLEDIFPSMIDHFDKGIQLAPTTRFTEMDKFFRWKKGDINLFTGYANWGKTFFVLQLMLTKSIWDGWKWAVFCPENYPANDF